MGPALAVIETEDVSTVELTSSDQALTELAIHLWQSGSALSDIADEQGDEPETVAVHASCL
jgi:hypothetical protein